MDSQTIDYLTTPARSLKNGIRPRGKNEPNKEKCTNCGIANNVAKMHPKPSKQQN